MRILHDLPNPALTQATALTIGNFDGVHLGHRALVLALIREAHLQGWQAGLLTFHPHPVTVLRPNIPHHYLTTVHQRLAFLGHLGLDFAVVYPFTLETARTPARQFLSSLVNTLNLRAIWIGPDFALGRNREGDVAALRAMGDDMGFRVQVIEPYMMNGDEVRSGRIRSYLLEGDVAQAAVQLGWTYQVSGVVVGGAKRGTSIGFPTANLDVPVERLLPANGVYATWVDIQPAGDHQGGRYRSVTNIGVRPSFDNGQRTVETHILDFNGDIYGRHLTLAFVERLRPEMRFPDVGALRNQITSDVDLARVVLVESRASQAE